MTGHGVPSVYSDATALDADSNARLALARAQLIALEHKSTAQAEAIKYSTQVRGGHRVRIEGVRSTTFNALVRKGFVLKTTRLLTSLGENLREAGIYTRENPG